MKACTLFSSDNEVAEDWLVKFNSREPLDIYGQKYLIDEISTDYEHGFAGVTIKMYPAYKAKSPERPKKQGAWDGEGLPPVGTVCEVLWNESRMEYLITKVFGVNEHGQPIHRFDEGPKKYQYQADVLRTASGTQVFRPIKTAEQLAEEEKVAAIAEMQAVVMAASGCTVSTISECLAIVALYEAGYRKQ